MIFIEPLLRLLAMTLASRRRISVVPLLNSLRRKNQSARLHFGPSLGRSSHLIGRSFQRLLIQQTGRQSSMVLQLRTHTHTGVHTATTHRHSSSSSSHNQPSEQTNRDGPEPRVWVTCRRGRGQPASLPNTQTPTPAYLVGPLVGLQQLGVERGFVLDRVQTKETAVVEGVGL